MWGISFMNKTKKALLITLDIVGSILLLALVGTIIFFATCLIRKTNPLDNSDAVWACEELTIDCTNLGNDVECGQLKLDGKTYQLFVHTLPGCTLLNIYDANLYRTAYEIEDLLEQEAIRQQSRLFELKAETNASVFSPEKFDRITMTVVTDYIAERDGTESRVGKVYNMTATQAS